MEFTYDRDRERERQGRVAWECGKPVNTLESLGVTEVEIIS